MSPYLVDREISGQMTSGCSSGRCGFNFHLSYIISEPPVNSFLSYLVPQSSFCAHQGGTCLHRLTHRYIIQIKKKIKTTIFSSTSHLKKNLSVNRPNSSQQYSLNNILRSIKNRIVLIARQYYTNSCTVLFHDSKQNTLVRVKSLILPNKDSYTESLSKNDFF